MRKYMEKMWLCALIAILSVFLYNGIVVYTIPADGDRGKRNCSKRLREIETVRGIVSPWKN
jgi:hypothetical protein